MNNNRLYGRSALTTWFVFSLFGLSGILLSSARAQTPAPPELRLPPIAKAPVIDGTMAPGEWDGALQGYGTMALNLSRGGYPVLDRIQSRYWIAYDKDKVYIAEQLELPPWGTMDGKKRRISADVTSDSSMEFWINPDRPGIDQMDRTFYQFIANAYDSTCNMAHNHRVSGWMQFNGESTFKSTCRDGWWTAEFSVAASELHGAHLTDGATWGFLFGRHLLYDGIYSYSGWPSGDWYHPTTYTKVVLDQKAPVVQLHGLGQPYEGKPAFDYTLFNPTNAAIPVSVKMRVEDPSAPNKKREEIRSETLAPGERKKVQWGTEWTLAEKENSRLTTEVTSPDGRTSYFSTVFALNKDYSKIRAWADPPPKKQEVVWKPCFYPSFSRLRCLADISGLTAAATVKKGDVVVRDTAGKEIGRGTLENFIEGESEVTIQLPQNLAEGVYTAGLTLSDGMKSVGSETTKQFTKQKFPFENNTIGISDKVLYPWTPMQVDAAKTTVACWNREFALGDNGFFKQVKSGQWQLLKRPMQLAAKSGGKELKWKAGGVKFGKTADSAVDFTAASECEKVKAEVAVHSEYDGMFQYTLTLTPRGDGQVDGLDLVVPIKEENAWLLHATSDGCRTNASLFTPQGKGRVWDSREVAQWPLTGTVIPYLWLGDDRVGLCWWADSAKGWVRTADKKKQPSIEVRRAKGEVQMVFHLVGRPFQLKEPRTLVFAFNADPIKPRPSWARGWTMQSTKDNGYRKGPYIFQYGSASWVSTGQDRLPDRGYAYGSLRPISDEAEKWLREYNTKKHAASQEMIVYTDILTRAVDRGEEVKNYAAEWDRYGMPHTQDETQGWKSDSSVVTNMAKSRMDYDLWCIQHGTDLGIDGWYFDEIQTVGQVNPAAGWGFKDEEGNWEAETSLFPMRNYLKRVYTLLQQAGHKEPFIMPHTSSTMYAGPLAFATIPMDLEMAAPDPIRGQIFSLGEGYAMCNVMGFNHGFAGSGMVCPYPYEYIVKNDYRIVRTFLGSMLLFDCHPIHGIPSQGGEGYRMDYSLGKFGYDDPGVEYVPYWRAADLQVVEPASLRVSLFRNGKKALLVMCNDSDKTVKARWKPTSKFKQTGAMTIPDLVDFKETTLPAPVREADGSWTLEIPPYDYRLVHTGTEGTWGAKEGWGAVDPQLFARNVKTVTSEGTATH